MKTLEIPLKISENVLWGVVGLAILIFAVISAVFVYHWHYYGIEGNSRVFVKGFYFVGGITFIILMVIFLGVYAYA